MSTVTSLTARPSHTPIQSSEPLNDRRSSSLSELVDRDGQYAFEALDRVNGNDPEANDTEAETERIEDSPFQRREQQNAVLTSGDADSIIAKRSSLDIKHGKMKCSEILLRPHRERESDLA